MKKPLSDKSKKQLKGAWGSKKRGKKTGGCFTGIMLNRGNTKKKKPMAQRITVPQVVQRNTRKVWMKMKHHRDVKSGKRRRTVAHCSADTPNAGRGAEGEEPGKGVKKKSIRLEQSLKWERGPQQKRGKNSGGKGFEHGTEIWEHNEQRNKIYAPQMGWDTKREEKLG